MLTSELRLLRFSGAYGAVYRAFARRYACPAKAFDINAGVTKESGPFDLFKFGFKAYKSGQQG